MPLLVTLLACNQPAGSEDTTSTGTETVANTGTDGGNEAPCAKLQVRTGDTCEPVAVTGFTTEPFEFERDGWTLAGTLYRPEVEAADYAPPARSSCMVAARRAALA